MISALQSMGAKRMDAVQIIKQKNPQDKSAQPQNKRFNSIYILRMIAWPIQIFAQRLQKSYLLMRSLSVKAISLYIAWVRGTSYFNRENSH